MNGKIAHVVNLIANLTIDNVKYCSVIQASNIILQLGTFNSLTFVNIVHIYTLLNCKYDSCYRLSETTLQLEMLFKFVQLLNLVFVLHS